jgi:hypothetical protein
MTDFIQFTVLILVIEMLSQMKAVLLYTLYTYNETNSNRQGSVQYSSFWGQHFIYLPSQ